MDKGQPVPVILNKKVKETGPLEVNVHQNRINQRVVRKEQISFDKIVQDSDSNFYITGKTTKIGLLNFLNLIDRHQMGEVDGLHEEDVVVSSELVTRIATAPVCDEDEEDMKYIDSLAIGIFSACFLMGIFALFSKNISDIKTFAWILLLVSGIFLGNYTYKGIKSGELRRVARICIKSLSSK